MKNTPTQTTNNPTQKSPGNKTEGTKHYKDPTGKNADISTPQNSGYDEKQPSTKSKHP